MSEQVKPVMQMPAGGVLAAATVTALKTTGGVTRGATASAAIPAR